MPGTKWWMWRRPIRTLNSSGTPRRTPKVVSRTVLEEITNADSRLNSAVSPVAASLVAAARDLDRVERGAGALLDHLGRGLRLLGDDPPAPELADLAGRDRPDRASATAPISSVRCSRRSSLRRRRSTRSAASRARSSAQPSRSVSGTSRT